MRKLVFLMLFFCLALSGRTARMEKKGDAEFSELVKRFFDAWNTFDLDKAGAFYAKDADLVFYDILPMKYAGGWSDYRNGVKKYFVEPLVSGKLIPYRDLKVTRRGTVAWTTITFHLSAKLKNGKAMELEARDTAIWEKRGKEWLIVHEHVSTPLPES